MSTEDLSYWKWLIRGSKGGSPGLLLYWNPWLLFHLAVAFVLASLVKDASTSQAVIIPFVSILIAVTVAWCGNVTAILNTDEIIELSDNHPVGIETYTFSVLNVVLCLLITIVSWTLYSLGLGNCFIGRTWVFFMSSLVIRECWHLILFVQMLTIARTRIVLKNKKQDRSNKIQN